MSVSAQGNRGLLGGHRDARPLVRRQTGGFFQPGQGMLPGRHGRRAVLRRKPAQIIPIRRDPRQHRGIRPLRIEREQLLHQDRHRPAVGQQMMAGQNHPMPIRRKADQHAPPQRRRRQIKPLRTVLAQKLGDTLLGLRLRQRRQIDLAPDRVGGRPHDLHRPAQLLMLKATAQVGVALQQRAHCSLENLLLKRTLKVQRQLNRVHVGRLRIIKRMEQQTLLQRRQRQHILKVRILALQPLKLSLRHRYQRNIRRRPAARLNLK